MKLLRLTQSIPVILGEIKKLFRDGGTVKVSRSLKELGMKAAAERDRLTREKGVEPTISELAEVLGARAETVAMAVRAGLPAISLTAENEDGIRELDIPVESPEEMLADRISLNEVMAALPAEERLLLRLRYFCGKTQSETAKLMHTTQVQISRRDRKILRKMREQL